MDKAAQALLREVERGLLAADRMLQLLREQALSESQDAYVRTIATALAELRAHITPEVVKSPRPTQHHGTQRSVLIAESDAVQRMWLKETFESSGFEVGCAVNGPDTIRSANERRWDIILVDCHIPVLDGFTVAEVLRSSDDSPSRCTPIVAYSANTSPIYRQRCIDAGMTSFLPKPTSRETVLKHLEAVAQVSGKNP